MRISLHIPTARAPAAFVSELFSARHKALSRKGILYSRAAGRRDHGRLFLAALPPDNPFSMLSARGLRDPLLHKAYSLQQRDALGQEIVKHRPDRLFLSFPDAATVLDETAKVLHFRNFLSEFGQNTDVVLHIASPAQTLLDDWIARILAGHTDAPTQDDLDRVDTGALQDRWAHIFDPSCVRTLPWEAEVPFDARKKMLRRGFELDGSVGFPETLAPPAPPLFGQFALRRLLKLNRALKEFEAQSGEIPARIAGEYRTIALTSGPAGEALRPSHLIAPSADSDAPVLNTDALPDLRPDPNFDPATILTDLPDQVQAWRTKLDRRNTARRAQAKALLHPRAKGPGKKSFKASDPAPELSSSAQAIFSEKTKAQYQNMAKRYYVPRNVGLVSFDEAVPMPPLSPTPAPMTDTLLIACMKNEAPYILEWVAYHLSIGIGHFLIFTNDCTDSTTDILDRLSQLGHVTHERNDVWKGKSPQQAALNKAIAMPLVQKAGWWLHTDVDEYINIRHGNGSMDELLEAMGDASNLAMTWRLFGNNGERGIKDGHVVNRFEHCAPAWAPKPHTLWGFKSITRNTGAYAKLSCHRPNKPTEIGAPVRWLNGSLQDVTSELAIRGWRSSVKSIGYDAVQLNHYALRSRDSFLVKRQRGRALHVNRSIGANYWLRHDWHQHRDVSIQRHLPRMQTVLSELMADPKLATLHASGLQWHLDKAAELHNHQEFKALINEIDGIDLTDTERVAWAMTEDMES